MHPIEQLPLWGVLKDKATDGQRDMVKRLAENAAVILDRVIETFPTYTLHNSTHAENVVRLMSDLLGPRHEELSGLEAALLILSAYYHDIGMVFSKAERQALTQEPEWVSFLDKYPQAYVETQARSEIPVDIAEWYCRWRHAGRVFVYLNLIPDNQLRWGQVSIREELGELCRSHNLDTVDLMSNPLLQTDFLAKADLRFCALLLRLADILDFDRSRSPDSVYQYLELTKRDTPRVESSDVEWRKHLCSEGFIFPKERSPRYAIGFVAGPNEPAVEYDLREFLEVIEDEFTKCTALITSCSPRWRDFHLPGGINRGNIHSNGYRYGEYRFTLEQNQVLDLLMGENLYEDPYVFVRELIQNAIDTSRHRQYIERAHGHPKFVANPIQVCDWIDQDGYHWVRFDDFGMGMDEEIARNHLLRVGSSYYQTARFRAEILKAQERGAADFTPISRFGIGLLSCFIAADQVEVSTLRRRMQGDLATPIRLSLRGLHGFFTLQSPNLTAAPMPSPYGKEEGYRTESGTSIVVRLDPHKEKDPFELETLLNRYVLYPPIPVELDGQRVGEHPYLSIDQPWTEHKILALDSGTMGAIGNFLGIGLSEPLEIEFLPIDLTRHSASPDLKGQILIISLRSNNEWNQLTDSISPVASIQANIGYEDQDLHLALSIELDTKKLRGLYSYDMPDSLRKIKEHMESTSSRPLLDEPWRNYLRLPVGDFLNTHEGKTGEALKLLGRKDHFWLSHNGVAVPTMQLDRWASQLRLSSIVASRLSVLRIGIISLFDSLRPDMSVSRDRLRGLSCEIYSAVNLALSRSLRAAGEDLRATGTPNAFDALLGRHHLLLGHLLRDPFIRGDGFWNYEPVVKTWSGFLSIQEIKNSIRGEKDGIILQLPSPNDILYGHIGFSDCCAAALSQMCLNISLDPTEYFSTYRAEEGSSAPILPGQMLFPPLAFVPFSQTNALRARQGSLNLNHPFSRWLLEKAVEINRKYPGIFDLLRSNLCKQTWSQEDWRKQLEAINRLLERLRKLDPSVRPPKYLDLKMKDSFFTP